MIEVAGPSEEALIAKARRAFRDQFGREASFVAIAPGRVNLIGDHVDYAGGLVLPMAIDRWTVAAGDWSVDPRRARLYAVDLDETAELDLMLGDEDESRRLLGVPVGHWSGYIAGVFAYMKLRAPPRRPARAVDVAITSSVPRASGLSSSAALEVCVAKLLDRAWGLEVPTDELALACQHAEHLGGGVQCGMMDQFASALGVAGHAIRIDCADLRVSPSPIDPGLGVLVVDTRVPRQLSAGMYGELVARIQRVRFITGVALRRLTHERIKAAAVELGPEACASAAHFVDENARVDLAAAYLAAGDARGLAEVMLASHASLRDRLGVSCAELEVVVSAAEACGPQVGARLTGAGMGGCAVVVGPRNRLDEIGNAVGVAFVEAFGRECGVMGVRAVEGGRSEM